MMGDVHPFSFITGSLSFYLPGKNHLKRAERVKEIFSSFILIAELNKPPENYLPLTNGVKCINYFLTLNKICKRVNFWLSYPSSNFNNKTVNKEKLKKSLSQAFEESLSLKALSSSKIVNSAVLDHVEYKSIDTVKQILEVVLINDLKIKNIIYEKEEVNYLIKNVVIEESVYSLPGLFAFMCLDFSEIVHKTFKLRGILPLRKERVEQVVSILPFLPCFSRETTCHSFFSSLQFIVARGPKFYFTFTILSKYWEKNFLEVSNKELHKSLPVFFLQTAKVILKTLNQFQKLFIFFKVFPNKESKSLLDDKLKKLLGIVKLNSYKQAILWLEYFSHSCTKGSLDKKKGARTLKIALVKQNLTEEVAESISKKSMKSMSKQKINWRTQSDRKKILKIFLIQQLLEESINFTLDDISKVIEEVEIHKNSHSFFVLVYSLLITFSNVLEDVLCLKKIKSIDLTKKNGKYQNPVLISLSLECRLKKVFLIVSFIKIGINMSIHFHQAIKESKKYWSSCKPDKDSKRARKKLESALFNLVKDALELGYTLVFWKIKT